MICVNYASKLKVGLILVVKIYRMNKIFALVTSTPKRSSHAIDKDIEVKKLLYKLINNVCVIIVIYFEYFVDPKGLLSSIVVIYPSPDVKKHLSLIIFHWGKIHFQCGG
jgi:hypothetical protein